MLSSFGSLCRVSETLGSVQSGSLTIIGNTDDARDDRTLRVDFDVHGPMALLKGPETPASNSVATTPRPAHFNRSRCDPSVG